MEKLAEYGDHAILLLRIALGAVFAYFGINGMLDPARQGAIWIASWAPAIFSSSEFIFIFGVVQSLVALFLILGIWLRWTSLIAASLLVGIIANLGFGELAFRDFGLLASSLVLATREDYRWVLHP